MGCPPERAVGVRQLLGKTLGCRLNIAAESNSTPSCATSNWLGSLETLAQP